MGAVTPKLLLRQVDAADPRWIVVVTRRFKRGNHLAQVGDTLLLPRLMDAVHIIRMKNGRPGDRRTELDTELAMLLQKAIPAVGGNFDTTGARSEQL